MDAAKQPTRHTRPWQSKGLRDSNASMSKGVSRDLFVFVASSDMSCPTTSPLCRVLLCGDLEFLLLTAKVPLSVLTLMPHSWYTTAAPDDKSERETAGLGNNIIIPSNDKCKPDVRNPPTWSLHPFPTVPRLGNKVKAH